MGNAIWIAVANSNQALARSGGHGAISGEMACILIFFLFLAMGVICYIIRKDFQ